jgi:glycosyltransferase involved in cell wall biosynthesis
VKAKVCYLIGSFATGGAEGQLLELLRRIDRTRFEPSLVLQAAHGIERVDGLVADVRSLDLGQHPRGLARGYRASLSLRQLCSYFEDIRPDIVHAFLPASCIFGAGCRLFGKVPCLISSRRSMVGAYRPNSRLEALADVVATRVSDFVLGNSGAVVQEVISIDGLPTWRTQVIYNGVDTERFSPAKRPGMRCQLGWGAENLVFGTMANFFAYKRHVDFVRAAAIVYKAVPNARFLLVGEDRGEIPAVERAIHEAGLGPYTRIVAGTKTPEQAFAAMDVYVCPSETEGFSNVLLEAMAAGLPVIATDVGGNKEAVCAGHNGIMVAAHVPEQIADAAITLAKDPGRLLQFSQNSRRRAEEMFSLEQMVRKHERLYTELLSQKRTSTWKRLIGRDSISRYDGN